MNLTKFQIIYRMLPKGAGWSTFHLIARSVH